MAVASGALGMSALDSARIWNCTGFTHSASHAGPARMNRLRAPTRRNPATEAAIEYLPGASPAKANRPSRPAVASHPPVQSRAAGSAADVA